MQTLHTPCIHMSFLSHPNLHRELSEMAQAMWRQRLLFQFQDYIENEDYEELFLASIVYQLANDTEHARTHNGFKPRQLKNLWKIGSKVMKGYFMITLHLCLHLVKVYLGVNVWWITHNALHLWVWWFFCAMTWLYRKVRIIYNPKMYCCSSTTCVWKMCWFCGQILQT